MSTLDSTTPTALVTGGSRGIGRAVALTLARDGYQVILTYVSRPEEADKTVAEIEAAGGRALALPLNVGDGEAVAAFFAEHIKGKVNLAVLVNNAGITKDGFLVRMKDDDFDRVITINLRGAFICTREAAKIMTKARHGRIVNISSVVGQMGNAGQANYAAAKAGLIGLTKTVAKELAARNITCNAIAPGFITTDMTMALSEDIQAAILAQIAMKRFGSTEEVAAAVAFLGSREAAYITGQVLEIAGGLAM